MAATATVVPSTLKITATQGILAMKGSGKTYRAMAQAEEMLDRGAQIVCIDPTGAWWGLRYQATDTSRVLYPQLALLGGDKGSIDLLDSHGTVVAKAVVEKKMSCVLDLSRMSKAGMRRFVAAFLLELFRTNPNRQIHLFIDEADLFAPQHAQGEAATVAGAMSDVVRRGRKKGIGVTMISQRPQALSTDVRNQCDVMTLLRVKGTHDLDAIEDWLDSNGYNAKALRLSISRMQPGDYVCCAGDDGEFGQRHARADTIRKSFDSGRTPEEGDEAVGLVQAFDADLLREWLGEASEELEKNDPKALQQRVRDLESELAAKSSSITVSYGKSSLTALEGELADANKDIKRIELLWRAEKEGRLTQSNKLFALRDLARVVIKAVAGMELLIPRDDSQERAHVSRELDIIEHGKRVVAETANTPEPGGRNGTGKSTLRRLPTVGELAAPGAPMPDFVGETEAVTQSHEAQRDDADRDPRRHDPEIRGELPATFKSTMKRTQNAAGLGACARALLATIRSHDKLTTEQVAVLSGYSKNSSGFDKAMGQLRREGLIEGSPAVITSKGHTLAVQLEIPMYRIKGEALRNKWLSQLSKCECEIIETLAANRSGLDAQTLAQKTPSKYSTTSSGWDKALGRLRRLELITRGPIIELNKLLR